MSRPAGVVDTQLRALLELVEQYRDDRCHDLLDQAGKRRKEILQAAHREARDRMRRAVTAERRRIRQALTAAQAELQTRVRHQEYRFALDLLHSGWERLRDALTARWDDRESREAWVTALADQALVVLPRCRWRIEHPPQWEPNEAERPLQAIASYCGEPPELAAEPALAAGLRIAAGAAYLDGSIDGLLADRATVEARLLAEIKRELGGRWSDPQTERESHE